MKKTRSTTRDLIILPPLQRKVVATWPDGETVELLAINPWREEETFPIRLLYPTDVGPPPEGNESAIRVRLPAVQAEAVVRALIEACQET